MKKLNKKDALTSIFYKLPNPINEMIKHYGSHPMLKNGLAFSIGLCFAFIIAEIFLRIYQPFPIAIKSNNLFLKANTKVTYFNKKINGLDEQALNVFNALGFRGEELPKDLQNYFSLLAIGGSTTACNILSEGKDWVHLLKNRYHAESQRPIWVNNAGLNGNSTYGHLLLLKEHILNKFQPNFILFLIGINDIDRKDLEYGDGQNYANTYFTFFDWLKKKSETVLLIENTYRSYKGYSVEIGKELSYLLNPTYQTIKESELEDMLKEQQSLVDKYEQRIHQLIQLTYQIGSIPVFITQPLLYGEAIDPVTGTDLGNIKTYRFGNGIGYWRVLEAYNQLLRKVCKERGVVLIDLARKMPKSSTYYIDAMHFTNAGAEKVAQIIWEDWLSQHIYEVEKE